MNRFFLLSLSLILLTGQIEAQDIIHYWHFNNASGELGTVPADISLNGQTATLLYQKINEGGDDIGIMDDVAGTSINARLGFEDGRGIRPRNPSANGELQINMSTEGFENIQLSYATERSGQGMLQQQIWYTTDGNNYQTLGNPINITTDYALVQFDLTGIAGANDNPLFAVKIRFLGQNTAGNGNNRIDNLVLEGSSLSTANLIHYWHFNDVSGEVETVPADIFNGDVAPNITYQKIDEAGADIGIMDDVNGSAINARLNFEAGRGIRPRNPSANAELVMELNSSGFENLMLSYAAERSGQGMLQQQLLVTTDGDNWESFGEPVDIVTDYALVSYDFSGFTAANDNPNFAAKIHFIGQNEGESGNNRIDNVVLEGNSLGGAVEGVSILGDDLDLVVGETAQLQAVVTPATAINQNVTWSSADEDVASVSASGLVLATGPGSTEITVLTEEGAFSASIGVNVTGMLDIEIAVSSAAGPLVGAMVILDGESDVTDADGMASFQRLPGTYPLAVTAQGFIGIETEIEVDESSTTPIELSALPSTLLYYWHFNDLPEGEAESVASDFTEISGLNPTITYEFLPEYVEDPELTEGFMDDFGDGSDLNLQLGEEAGIALRVRNRSEGRALLIPSPTVGYENLVLSYDVQRSGSGMLVNRFEYTLDGSTWSDENLETTEVNINTSYESKFVDFSQVSGAANNPNFAVRILFEGNTDQGNGNNRYDNVAIFADLLLSSETHERSSSSLRVYPNPSAAAISIDIDGDQLVPISNYHIFDMRGKMVKSGQIQGNQAMLDLNTLESGTYILLLQNGDRIMQQVIVRSH